MKAAITPDDALRAAEHAPLQRGNAEKPSGARHAALLTLPLFGVVAALALFEFAVLRGALGYHGLQEVASVYIYDRVLGWRFRPEATAIHSDLDFCVHYRTNSHGLREREMPYEKPAGTFRILVLGDSFTEGYGVEPEQCFTRQMEDLLQSQSGRRVEVISAGVRGYSTDQEYLYLKQEGWRYQPHLVLLAFVRGDENNTPVMGHMGSRVYFKPYFELKGGELNLEGVPVPLVDASSERSDRLEPVKRRLRPLALYRWMQTMILGGRWRSTMTALGLVKEVAAEASESAPIDSPAFGADAWLVEDQLLRQMKEFAGQRGAELAVFLAAGSPVYARLLGEPLERFGVPFFDVANHAGFGEMVRSGALRLTHDGHWNARGHRLAAELLARELAPFVTQSPRTLQ